MQMKHILIPVLALALTGSALASGSAPMRPPRPPKNFAPAGNNEVDDSRYALGKAVFAGKSAPVANPSAAKKQKARLSQLASAIGKDGASLPALAGKLSDEQMDALDYYAAKRFGVQ